MNKYDLRLAVSAILLLILGGCSSPNPYVDIRSHGGGKSFAVAWHVLEREEGPSLTLVNMAHFGQVEFYTRVAQILAEQDLVLMEGVTGTTETPTQVMAHYRGIAETLGVTTQESALSPQDNWRESDVDAATIAHAVSDIELEISRFDRQLKASLKREIGFSRAKWPDLSELEHKENAQGKLRRLFAIGLTTDAHEDDPLIIIERNKYLLVCLEKYLTADDALAAQRIAICWGVAHTPDLLERLGRTGWSLVSTKWQPVFAVGEVHLPQPTRP